MAKKGASVEPQPPVVVAVFEDLITRLQLIDRLYEFS
jgi:hypothetical protein